MKKKLFVLSMDAMVREDIAYLATKPNFQKILGKRAEVDKVLTVYPACTYPAHTSLMTGCYPYKHGVYNNFPVSTWQDGIPHWPTHYTNVYAEDIFAAAKRAGLTTAGVFWPITACNPNIDHVINEYFFYFPGEGDRVEEIFAEQGSDEVALQAVKENLHLFPRSVRGSVPTEKLFDAFIMGCTCSLIRNAQPDVILLHNCLLDSMRHAKGLFGDHITAALDQTDLWLGDVLSAMEDAGVLEQTDFVLLSDHGQMEYDTFIHLNILFKEEGLIQLTPDGKLYEWQAFTQATGPSSMVYLRDNTNQKLYNRVYNLLQKLQDSGKYHIEKIFTKDELMEKYGQNGPYSFMVEAETGFFFGSKFDNCPTVETGKKSCGHGYLPEKGPQPIFMAHGPSFKEGAVVERANIVDVAPTLAATFGQTLSEADGKVLETLLK